MSDGDDLANDLGFVVFLLCLLSAVALGGLCALMVGIVKLLAGGP
jgi:hypothetical protein